MYKIKTSNPKKTAFNYIYGLDNLLFNKKIRLDMRFNYSYKVLELIKKYQISEVEKKRILTLKKERAINRNGEPIASILKNKLVVDYLKNKGYLTGVFDDHLRFGGFRNHWAKNETDLKVLAILKKHYLSK